MQNKGAVHTTPPNVKFYHKTLLKLSRITTVSPAFTTIARQSLLTRLSSPSPPAITGSIQVGSDYRSCTAGRGGAHGAGASSQFFTVQPANT